MRILGLIGSSRPLGNTELLVTEIAKAADSADGATSVHLLRLTDLRLAYCTGCMNCALDDGGACPLDDDMAYLMSEYRAADALILGAPAYTLLPPGPLKLIADRLIMCLAQSTFSTSKPAVTVGVAGLPRWSEMLLPLLNCTVQSLGFRLVDSLLAYGAGPGEVLLDAANVERARAAGQRLRRALLGEALRPSFGPGHCPVCGGDFFRLVETGVECPLCLTLGRLENNVAVFDPFPTNRWQPENLESHFKEWIQGTGPAYMDRRPEIRQLQRPYKNRVYPFIRPPAHE